MGKGLACGRQTVSNRVLPRSYASTCNVLSLCLAHLESVLISKGNPSPNLIDPTHFVFPIFTSLAFQQILDGVSSDAEVYFCGGGGINSMLKGECSKRGMKYAGSSVQ